MLPNERLSAVDPELCALLLGEDAPLAVGTCSEPAPPVRRDPATVSRTRPTVSTHNARRPRMINPSRERMQHDIATLQQQKIALEERLTALKRGEDDGQEQVMRVAWRTVAHDQQAQREAAEKERDRLRALIRANKLSIQRVRQFLLKTKGTESLADRARLCRSVLVNVDIAADFAEVSERMEVMHGQIDSVFQHSTLDRLVDEFYDLRIENDMTPNLSVEFRDARMLPFGVEETAEAVWIHRYTRAGLVSRSDEIVQKTEHSIRRSCDFLVSFESYKGVVHGFSETRRVVQGDCHYILHCTLVTRPGACDGFRCFLSSWTRVQRPSREIKTNKPSCQVDVFETTVPIVPTPTSIGVVDDATARTLRAVRDFCVDATTHLQRVERQMIENVLLDRIRTARRQ